MKTSLKNNFTPKTRSLFYGCTICFWCGYSINKGENVNALHHIVGRKSNSPLNACPIHNNFCHLYNPKLHKRDNEIMLINKTLTYLKKENYKLTDKDKEFYIKYGTKSESNKRQIHNP